MNNTAGSSGLLGNLYLPNTHGKIQSGVGVIAGRRNNLPNAEFGKGRPVVDGHVACRPAAPSREYESASFCASGNSGQRYGIIPL